MSDNADQLTPHERNCLDEHDDKDSVIEKDVKTSLETCEANNFLVFQNAASAISHLHKEGSRSENVPLWALFQNAAGAVTILYKDSQEMMRRSFELGTQLGGHRRTKEVLTWARKRRRHVLREDIISYASGKPIPVRTPHKSSSFGRGGASRYANIESTSPRHSSNSSNSGYYHGETSSFTGQSNPATGSRRLTQRTSPQRISPPLRNNANYMDENNYSESRKRPASGDARDCDSPDFYKRNRMDTDDY